MAMEIKTLDVDNEKADNIIEFWTQFGWNLKSSQRIYNQDTHLERRGDSTYSVTETVDFTRLVFERDKNGPYYAQLVTLEDEFCYKMQKAIEFEAEIEKLEQKWLSLENKLDFRTTASKVINILLLVFSIGFFLLAGGLGSAENISEEIVEPMVSIGAIGGLGLLIAFFITKKVGRRRALAAAKADPNSENGILYQRAYERAKNECAEVVHLYNEYTERCEEILVIVQNMI